MSVQSIELPVSCHGIKSRTRHTELIPQAATSGSVIWRAQNSTHTSCHLRIGHLAGTKQHPNTAISRASPRGHETAPRHRHLAGVTGQPLAIKNFECILTEQAMSFKKSNAISRKPFRVYMWNWVTCSGKRKSVYWWAFTGENNDGILHVVKFTYGKNAYLHQKHIKTMLLKITICKRS